MKIKRKIIKNGYSLMVTIPKDICDQMGINENTELCIDCIDNKIMMTDSQKNN